MDSLSVAALPKQHALSADGTLPWIVAEQRKGFLLEKTVTLDSFQDAI